MTIPKWAYAQVDELGLDLNVNQRKGAAMAVAKLGGAFEDTEFYDALSANDVTEAFKELMRLSAGARSEGRTELAKIYSQAADIFTRSPGQPDKPKKPKPSPQPQPKPKPAERVPMALLGAFGVLVALLGIWLLV